MSQDGGWDEFLNWAVPSGIGRGLGSFRSEIKLTGDDAFIFKDFDVYLPMVVHQEPPPAAPTLFAINNSDGDGNYSATFPDVPRGGRGEVRYRTEIAYAEVTFHRDFQSPDLIMTVDYGHDWVNGNYEPGHTVVLTVTESDGTTVKATAELTTGPVPEWGGQSGFQTQYEDWDSGSGVSIQSGDWVTGVLDGVHVSVVHVGLIDGELDVEGETVSGTVSASWLLPDTVTVRCEIHEEGAGDGVGEQRFLKAMQAAPHVQFILDDARQNGYPPGQQRAFVMAKVLEQNEVIIVGCQDPGLMRSAKFSTAPTIEDAFALVDRKLGSDSPSRGVIEALVVPHALLTLPIVQG